MKMACDWSCIAKRSGSIGLPMLTRTPSRGAGAANTGTTHALVRKAKYAVPGATRRMRP